MMDWLFFTIQQTCPQCGGYGETIGNPCKSCSGNGKMQANENVTVKIPKGVDDGTRIRLSGKGEAGSKGGSSVDLYLFILALPICSAIALEHSTPLCDTLENLHKYTVWTTLSLQYGNIPGKFWQALCTSCRIGKRYFYV